MLDLEACKGYLTQEVKEEIKAKTDLVVIPDGMT
jgi:hypothetical protein